MNWHPEIPIEATHVRFTSPVNRTEIVVERSAIDLFRAMPGQVTFGRLRYAEEFIPVPEDSLGFRNEPFKALLRTLTPPPAQKQTEFRFVAAPAAVLPVLEAKSQALPPPVKVTAPKPAKTLEIPGCSEKSEAYREGLRIRQTKTPAVERNGVLSPSPTSQAGIAWQRFRDFEISAKRSLTRSDYLTIGTEEGIKPASVAVYFSNWKKFNA